MMRKHIQYFAAILSAAGAAIVLALDTWLVAFDKLSSEALGERIRSILPWSGSMLIGSLLPLYSLTYPTLAALSAAGISASLAWLSVGLALAEIYAVLLRRESWICAYEPHWISLDAQPLRYPPYRYQDRRLHRLLRTQIHFGAPAAFSAALTPLGPDSVAQCVVATYFLLKYFSYSGPDFEAVVHWAMHSRTLKSAIKTRKEGIAYALMEYICGPINGYVPRVYESNHLLIHHIYNGNIGDIHSPAAFDRLSFVEFSVFAWRLTADTLFCTDLLRHKNCKGRKRKQLITTLIFFWSMVSLLIFLNSLLPYLLLGFLLHHGVTMARFQIIWHGLIAPEDPRSAASSTVNWVPLPNPEEATTFWLPPLVTQEGRLADCATTRQDLVPHWQHHWAFFDNLHLLHHQNPSTHFSEYPSKFLLAQTRHDSLPLNLDLQFMSTHCMALWQRDLPGAGQALIGTNTAEATKLIWARTRPIGPPPRLINRIRGTVRLAQLDSIFVKTLKAVGVPFRGNV